MDKRKFKIECNFCKASRTISLSKERCEGFFKWIGNQVDFCPGDISKMLPQHCETLQDGKPIVFKDHFNVEELL
jgi:hypothetical protein